MACQQCGASLKDGAKFCASCGTPVNQQEPTTEHVQGNESPTAQPNEVAATADPSSSIPPSNPDPQEESTNWTEHKLVKGTVDVSKNYWTDFKKSLTTPMKYSLETTQANAVNGLITIGLLSLFIAGVFYSTKGMLLNPVSSLLSLFEIAARPSFLQDFIRPFIVFLLLVGIMAGAIYLVCKLMRANPSFLDIVARFGAFLTIPAILFLLAWILGIIGSYTIVLYLSFLGLLMIGTAISLTIYSYKQQEDGGLDPLYGIIVAFAISGVGYLILNQLFY